jgi:Holliday junction resolvasome RuvABC ATP-dependent DNA helicase subunit
MFVGQEKIIKELDLLAERIEKDSSFNPSILFTANSGYGKTDLGLRFCNLLTKGNFFYSIADSEEHLDSILKLKDKPRVIFFDEIHLLERPEIIYPYIDKKETIFIFATNQSSKLNEALQNRCINLIFAPYTKKELRKITQIRLPILKDKPKSFSDLIIKGGDSNPRKIVNLCIRLQTVFMKYRFPDSKEGLISILADILNIKDGLDIQQQTYLETLKTFSHVSLDTLASVLGYNKETIKYEIEPGLLYRGLIEINSKGRSIKNGNN